MMAESAPHSCAALPQLLYRPSGDFSRPIPALGDRLMVGLQTLTLPV